MKMKILTHEFHLFGELLAVAADRARPKRHEGEHTTHTHHFGGGGGADTTAQHRDDHRPADGAEAAQGLVVHLISSFT